MTRATDLFGEFDRMEMDRKSKPISELLPGRKLTEWEDVHLRAWLSNHVGGDYSLAYARVLTYVRRNPWVLDHENLHLRLGWPDILDRATP